MKALKYEFLDSFVLVDSYKLPTKEILWRAHDAAKRRSEHLGYEVRATSIGRGPTDAVDFLDGISPVLEYQIDVWGYYAT